MKKYENVFNELKTLYDTNLENDNEFLFSYLDKNDEERVKILDHLGMINDHDWIDWLGK